MDSRTKKPHHTDAERLSIFQAVTMDLRLSKDSLAECCRRQSITDQNYYAWQKQFGAPSKGIKPLRAKRAMAVSEA